MSKTASYHSYITSQKRMANDGDSSRSTANRTCSDAGLPCTVTRFCRERHVSIHCDGRIPIIAFFSFERVCFNTVKSKWDWANSQAIKPNQHALADDM